MYRQRRDDFDSGLEKLTSKLLFKGREIHRHRRDVPANPDARAQGDRLQVPIFFLAHILKEGSCIWQVTYILHISHAHFFFHIFSVQI